MARGIGGEIGWWCPSLDDVGNGTTTLTDLSGVGGHGTLTSPMTGSDWVSDTTSGGIRALSFDTTKWVSIPFTGINSVSAFTMSAWLKRNTAGAEVTITQCLPTVLQVTGIEHYLDGFVYGDVANGNVNGRIASAGTNWTHVIIQFDGTAIGNANRLKMWVNGIAASLSFTGTIPIATQNYSGQPLMLGRIRYSNTGRFSAGRIDDVRMFSRQLSTVEITALSSMRGYQPPSQRRRSAQRSIRSTF